MVMTYGSSRSNRNFVEFGKGKCNKYEGSELNIEKLYYNSM